MAPSLQPDSAAGPLALYAQCVSEGKLKDDEAQRQIIHHLHRLFQQLRGKNAAGRLLRLVGIKPAAVRSLYIWGDVGRGKSLLMNMFYQCAPVQPKRRIHFHAFMQDVHAISHVLRQSKKPPRDLLQAVAETIVSEYGQLICLDELQVTDVADAMILSKLFTALLDLGVVFVITSNRPPDELYRGGLQREAFMEFIHLLHEKMDVLELASAQDYRMQQMQAMRAVYMWPRNEETNAALRGALAEMTHRAAFSPATLDVQGRKLTVSHSYGGIARFTFDELCAQPLGAADYLAICHRFHTVFIEGIPRLTADKRNEARRFVTLIDALYEHHVKLICTADAPPEGLYPQGDGTFEFHRTVSRLAEMQSAQYLASHHIP